MGIKLLSVEFVRGTDRERETFAQIEMKRSERQRKTEKETEGKNGYLRGYIILLYIIPLYLEGDSVRVVPESLKLD